MFTPVQVRWGLSGWHYCRCTPLLTCEDILCSRCCLHIVWSLNAELVYFGPNLPVPSSKLARPGWSAIGLLFVVFSICVIATKPQSMHSNRPLDQKNEPSSQTFTPCKVFTLQQKLREECVIQMAKKRKQQNARILYTLCLSAGFLKRWIQSKGLIISFKAKGLILS